MGMPNNGFQPTSLPPLRAVGAATEPARWRERFSCYRAYGSQEETQFAILLQQAAMTPVRNGCPLRQPKAWAECSMQQGRGTVSLIFSVINGRSTARRIDTP